MKLREVMKESMRKRIKQLKKDKEKNQSEILLLQMEIAMLSPQKKKKHEAPKESVDSASVETQKDGEGSTPEEA